MTVRRIITAAPRQLTLPKPGEKAEAYEPVNQPRLACPESFGFPAINIMKGYVESGDEVELLVITANYEASKNSYDKLGEQALAMGEQLGAHVTVTPIEVEFSESSEDHLKTFEKLVEHIQDGDRLSACVTFGSKPTAMLEIMALNYGYRTCKNVAVDCIAYGEVDHNTNPWKKKIYDVTSLFLMDQLVNELGQHGHRDTLSVIRQILTKE